MLPALPVTPGSRLVTVSSVFRIVAPPGHTAYAASKAVVRGFTDALRAELLPAGVRVTCVLPGGVATNVARDAPVGSGVPADRVAAERAAASRFLRMPPATAAEAILRARPSTRRRPLTALRGLPSQAASGQGAGGSTASAFCQTVPPQSNTCSKPGAGARAEA